MQLNSPHEYAKILIGTYGPKAEVFVAHKIKSLEASDQSDSINLWKKIRLSIKEMRGPHVS